MLSINFSLFNFSKLFSFYVDNSKKKEFEIAIYQLDKKETKTFALFLFRNLVDVKTRYYET